MTTKSNPGNFLEDFRQGQIIAHATPRTITEGDVALNIALTGSRYALFSADSFAQNCGLPGAPVDPLLVFHTVFGKTVPDISLNAVSEVLGVKQNSNGKTGVVTVRTTGFNQDEIPVLSYVRWVMVNKREASAEVIDAPPKTPASSVPPPELVLPQGIDFTDYDFGLAGSPHAFQDYEVGEKIDHVDGMTVEEAEHQLATRLYQNTAKVHFDALAQKESRFGKRLIYGGVTISIARALAFNGLANAQLMIAINGGRHVNPLFAGDTLYAWSEVLAKEDLGEIGALRLRLVAVKNKPAADFPFKNDAGEYDPNVVLDFDYWAALPKR
jgi:2-methylfumaryl-CoA hydratase